MTQRQAGDPRGEGRAITLVGVVPRSPVPMRDYGQMAVYVKPRGLFGKGYMALIKPFRYLIVYPALMRQTERMWNTRVPQRHAM